LGKNVGGGELLPPPLPYFFYMRKVFFWLVNLRGAYAKKKKKKSKSEGKGRKYIKGWFKPIFSLFLT
jgi:hypothetical protein